MTHEVRGLGYYESPHIKTIGDVCEEVMRAREKFPGTRRMLAALVEEVGELANAMLEDPEDHEKIYAEAKQVCAVAIRIMEEGDESNRVPTPRPPNPSWRGRIERAEHR